MELAKLADVLRPTFRVFARYSDFRYLVVWVCIPGLVKMVPRRDAGALRAEPLATLYLVRSKQKTRDAGGGQGPHLHEQDFGRTTRGTEVGLSCSQARKKKERITAPQAKKRKEKRQPEGGMGGRHAATTRGSVRLVR